MSLLHFFKSVWMQSYVQRLFLSNGSKYLSCRSFFLSKFQILDENHSLWVHISLWVLFSVLKLIYISVYFNNWIFGEIGPKTTKTGFWDACTFGKTAVSEHFFNVSNQIWGISEFNMFEFSAIDAIIFRNGGRDVEKRCKNYSNPPKDDVVPPEIRTDVTFKKALPKNVYPWGVSVVKNFRLWVSSLRKAAPLDSPT